ncbi:hypothetical protein RI367_001639 [Sorochytrium milnesiophthora]
MLTARALHIGSRRALCYSSLAGIRRYASSTPSSSGDSKDQSAAGKTHFGFRTVDEEEKESLVGKVFGSVASSYDVMNDAMSLGIHRLWKNRFIEKLAPGPDTRLLDVAGGTGDIALRFLQTIDAQHGGLGNAHVTVLDINPAMLEVGKERFAKLGLGDDTPHVEFVEGNAEKLDTIPDSSVDAYTIAFGIRNCTHIDRVIREAHRVLRPGGRFMCLEFGKVGNPVLSKIYDEYSFRVIPHIGHIVANDRDSYQYLVESIRRFPSQEEFVQMMKKEGFKVAGSGYEDLTFGVATIWSGWKL